MPKARTKRTTAPKRAKKPTPSEEIGRCIEQSHARLPFASENGRNLWAVETTGEYVDDEYRGMQFACDLLDYIIRHQIIHDGVFPIGTARGVIVGMIRNGAKSIDVCEAFFQTLLVAGASRMSFQDVAALRCATSAREAHFRKLLKDERDRARKGGAS